MKMIASQGVMRGEEKFFDDSGARGRNEGKGKTKGE